MFHLYTILIKENNFHKYFITHKHNDLNIYSQNLISQKDINQYLNFITQKINIATNNFDSPIWAFCNKIL